MKLTRRGITLWCAGFALAGILAGATVWLWPRKLTHVPPQQVARLVCPNTSGFTSAERTTAEALAKRIRRIVRGAGINFSDSDGNTALILAAQLRNRTAICWLAALGADATCKNNEGLTALDYTDDPKLRHLLTECMNESKPLTEAQRAHFRLRTSHSLSEGTDEQGVTSLSTCASRLKAGGDPTTLATYILYDGGDDMPEYLAYCIRRGADVMRARAMITQTTLSLPGEAERLLLALGFDGEAIKGTQQQSGLSAEEQENPNATDAEGSPLLHLAIREQNSLRVQQLLAAGADANACDRQNTSALALAIDQCAESDDGSEIVRMLLAAGASTFPKNRSAAVEDNAIYRLTRLVTRYAGDEEYDTRRAPALAQTLQHLLSANAPMLPHILTCFPTGVQREACSPRAADFARTLLRAGAIPTATDSSGHTALMTAACGDPPLAAQLIAEGVDVNARAKDGLTALHCALNSEVATLLLQAGASPKAEDKQGRSPLFYAILAHDDRMVQQLIAAGAPVNRRDKSGYTPLLLAVAHCAEPLHGEGVEIVRQLLAAGAEVEAPLNDKSGSKYTSLSLAVHLVSQYAQHENFASHHAPALLQVIRHLRIAGARVPEHAVSMLPPGLRDGVLPPICAEIARHLLDDGVDATLQQAGSFTPLMTAGSYAPELTSKLLVAGANVNVKTRLGWTALHSAQTPEVIELLLQAGANPHSYTTYKDRGTPLRNAMKICRDRLPEMARALVAAGSAVRGKDAEGNEWDIIRDISRRDLPFDTFRELVEIFAPLGADINSAWGGKYPAQLLIDLGATVKKDMLLKPRWARDAEALVAAGADINAQDDEGNTPLHKLVTAAASSGSKYNIKKIVQLYLKLGADPTITNRAGKTPANLAGGVALAALLKAGVQMPGLAEELVRNCHISTPDFSSAQRLECLRLLLQEQSPTVPDNIFTYISPQAELSAADAAMLYDMLKAAKANPTAVSKEGYTTLMTLGRFNADVTKQLLLDGVNPKAKAKNGYTALHGATTPEVAVALIAAGANVNARDERGLTPLHLANEHTVAPLLQAHAGINAMDNDGATPLCYALKNNRLPQAKALIAKGAHVKGTTPNGKNWDAMQALAQSEADVADIAELAALLIQNGSAPDLAWSGSETFVQSVSAQDLINYGADPLYRDKNGRTTLIMRPTEDDTLVPAGVDINAQDDEGNTALMLLVQQKLDTDTLKKRITAYLKKGADPTLRNKSGHTVMQAAHSGKSESDAVSALQANGISPWYPPTVAELICPPTSNLHPQQNKLIAELIRDIAKGKPINTPDEEGQTALMRASLRHRSLSACWLVAKGADLTPRNKNGKTALDLAKTNEQRLLLQEAAKEGYTIRSDEAVEIADSIVAKGISPVELALLVRRGYDVNTRTSDHRITLTTELSPDTVRLMLALGLKPDPADEATQMLAAVLCNDLPGVQALLGHNPQLINTRTARGSLLLSAQSAEMVRALVAAGANAKERPRQWEHRGRLYYTTLLSNPRLLKPTVLRELIAAGAEFDHDMTGSTPLHAHLPEDAELIAELVKAGIDPNATDSYGRTPLQCAAATLNATAVEALIAHGADPNRRNKQGIPPFVWIFENFYENGRNIEDEIRLGEVLAAFIRGGADITQEFEQHGVKLSLLHRALMWFSATDAASEDVQRVSVEFIRTLLMMNQGQAPENALLYIYPDGGHRLTHTRWAEIANMLLAAGANPKAIESTAFPYSDPGITSLMTVGIYDAALAKRLISAGVSPRARTRAGRTALHGARTAAVADTLIRAGANIEAEFQAFDTISHRPLQHIISRMHEPALIPELVERFLRSRARTKGKNWNIINELNAVKWHLDPEVYEKLRRRLSR